MCGERSVCCLLYLGVPEMSGHIVAQMTELECYDLAHGVQSEGSGSRVLTSHKSTLNPETGSNWTYHVPCISIHM